MTTTHDVFRTVQDKLAGEGRSLDWFAEQVGETLRDDVMPSDATLARLAYYANVSVSTLHPEKFDPDDNSTNARNFAEAAHAAHLRLIQGDQVWADVMNSEYRGIIPMTRWNQAIGKLAKQGNLL